MSAPIILEDVRKYQHVNAHVLAPESAKERFKILMDKWEGDKNPPISYYLDDKQLTDGMLEFLPKTIKPLKMAAGKGWKLIDNAPSISIGKIVDDKLYFSLSAGYRFVEA